MLCLFIEDKQVYVLYHESCSSIVVPPRAGPVDQDPSHRPVKHGCGSHGAMSLAHSICPTQPSQNTSPYQCSACTRMLAARGGPRLRASSALAAAAAARASGAAIASRSGSVPACLMFIGSFAPNPLSCPVPCTFSQWASGAGWARSRRRQGTPTAPRTSQAKDQYASYYLIFTASRVPRGARAASNRDSALPAGPAIGFTDQ
jgi:hypothetical protein